MRKTQHRFHSSQAESLTLSDLSKLVTRWLLDQEIGNRSRCTLANRRMITDKLLWFLRTKGHEQCGRDEISAFLQYVQHGHREPGGRWGNPRNSRPASPRTVRDYHGTLRAFFAWVVDEGHVDVSPMERIPTPISRQDQVVPLTQEQVLALLAAAERSSSRKRNVAIVQLLYDTGIRASELCALTRADLDIQSRRCTIEEGKGGKRRLVPMGKQTIKALWAYLDAEPPDDGEPIFRADRGGGAGAGLTSNGLLQLIRRLGRAAGIKGVRCSPHTLRHTFAVAFLRAGGNQMTLMEILGHTNVKMTARYVQLAQADIEQQHRQYSPGDLLRRRK